MEFNFPASGAVVWKNGSERMRITSGGNVGIGTSSPSSNINPSAASILVLKNTTAFPSLVLQGPTNCEGGITAANELYIDIAGNTSAASNSIVFRTSNTASSYSVTERMRITSGGGILANKTITGQVLTNGFEFNATDNYLSICNSVSANYSLYVANTGTSGYNSPTGSFTG